MRKTLILILTICLVAGVSFTTFAAADAKQVQIPVEVVGNSVEGDLITSLNAKLKNSPNILLTNQGERFKLRIKTMNSNPKNPKSSTNYSIIWTFQSGNGEYYLNSIMGIFTSQQVNNVVENILTTTNNTVKDYFTVKKSDNSGA